MDDSKELKERVDLAWLVSYDLGQPQRKHGRWYWWRCPFHADRDPSFGVTPDTGHYKCFGCGETGDHVDWLVKARGLTTKGAFDELRRLAGLPETKQPPPPLAETSTGDDEPPAAAWQAAGRAFVAHARDLLWTAAGAPGLAYLRAGGLTDDTIRRFGLGWWPGGPAGMSKHNPRKWGLEGEPVTLSRGVTFPCEVAGDLWYVKIRRFVGDKPATDKPKYPQPREGGAALFGADDLRADGRPLLLCEGERDTILAWQEVGDLVDVATLGGAGKKLGGRWLLWLLPYKRILAAYDTDAAGRKGADNLASMSRRVQVIRVPHSKDLADFHAAGGDLRAWLLYHLDRLGAGPGQLEPPAPAVVLTGPAGQAGPPDSGAAAKLAEARDFAREAEANGLPCNGYPSWAAWLVEVAAELGQPLDDAPAALPTPDPRDGAAGDLQDGAELAAALPCSLEAWPDLAARWGGLPGKGCK